MAERLDQKSPSTRSRKRKSSSTVLMSPPGTPPPRKMNCPASLGSHSLSSPSRGFDCNSREWDETLINVNFPTAEFLENIENQFTLEELFELPNTNLEGKLMKGEAYLEKCLKHELASELEGNQYFFQNTSYTVSCIQDLTEYLIPHNFNPDVAVLDAKKELPLLLCEVHSGQKYRDSIANCTVTLIPQLRYLRHFRNDLDFVYGFVFPKMNEKNTVTKIKLEWTKLLLTPTFENVEKENLKSTILEVWRHQCDLEKYVNINVKVKYFIPLSKNDLDHITSNYNIKHQSELRQETSGWSILMRDKDFYYKILPLSSSIFNLESFCKGCSTVSSIEKSCASTKNCVMYEYFIFDAHVTRYLELPQTIIWPMLKSEPRIFRFEALAYQPMTYKEVGQCFGQFVQQAIDAIEALHKLGYAHTDIRLPNFCFSADFCLKLIDFDRVCGISSYKVRSDHYELIPPTELSSGSALDFKQLGILIAQVMYPEMRTDKWNWKSFKKYSLKVNLINQLIFDGTYEKDSLNDWVKSLTSIVTIYGVLSLRLLK
ncbi:hypothetical protein LOD99_11341 [Oopsacas minuta]|uniref:Protein kinase domain-containing protein n=1 Tax=Oopsacas minuta TaxID=111878 RepID=A0AAV7K5J3_9METZ|nr:hypothetical protein LOD99_11341 [Oopsacas minuta]